MTATVPAPGPSLTSHPWFFCGIGAMEAIRAARVAEKSPLAAGFSFSSEKLLMEDLFKKSGQGRWMPPAQVTKLESAARKDKKAEEKYQRYCETSKRVLEFYMREEEEKEQRMKRKKKKKKHTNKDPNKEASSDLVIEQSAHGEILRL